MRWIMISIMFMGLIATVPDAQAQTYLNLDFEKSIPDGKPTHWYVGGQGYAVQIDTTTFYSGARSLHMQWVEQQAGSFGVATSTFPLDAARGKTIRFSGYIKTDSVTDGFASLCWRVDGANNASLALATGGKPATEQEQEHRCAVVHCFGSVDVERLAGKIAEGHVNRCSERRLFRQCRR